MIMTNTEQRNILCLAEKIPGARKLVAYWSSFVIPFWS